MRLRRSVVCSLAVTLVVACAKFEAADEPGTSSGTSPDAGPPPAAEDCVDGRDENGDGNPDCAEPTCLPHARCVPSPTTLGAWEGYTTLVDGAAACPPALPNAEEAFRADPEKPQCATCTCEPKTDCGAEVSITQGPIDCQQALLPFAATPGACTAIPKPAGGSATAWLVPSTGGTTCAAVSSGTTVTPSAKYRAVKVCSGVGRFGVGCPVGQVCAKREKLCVSKAVPPGAREACPPDFPIVEMVLPKSGDPEAGFVDTRSCSACSCAPAIGGGCDRTLALFGQAGCGAAPGPTVKSGTCERASCAGGCSSGLLSVTARPGTCGKGLSEATGGVTLAIAGRQYCCNAP